ncbi:hypothetical protein [Abyssisolibacter fermentans]|nr:hypothetical protein [Abyssisolibacter fermentans]
MKKLVKKVNLKSLQLYGQSLRGCACNCPMTLEDLCNYSRAFAI